MQLIEKHKSSYCHNPPKVTYARYMVLYECTKMQTAYYDNINAHFGNRLCAFLTSLYTSLPQPDSRKHHQQSAGAVISDN